MAQGPRAVIGGIVQRFLSSAFPDDRDQDKPVRLGRWGEITALLQASTLKHQLAEEGSYFASTNPTPGSNLSYAVHAAYVATVPFLYLQNNDVATNPSAKRTFLDYLKLIITTAPASTTQCYYAAWLDVSRAITAGPMTTITPNQTSMEVANAKAVTTVQIAGAVDAAATALSPSARLVARGAFGGLPVIGDELVIQCGSPSIGSYSGLTAAQATCPGRKVSNSPPLIIGPQQSLTVNLWFPGNATTGMSFEFEMGHWER